MSSIFKVITPKSKDLGDDFVVRRSLPDVDKQMVGPFIFWDHMGPVTLNASKPLKVRAHPHIGLATITWLFAGEIMHRDSLGNEQPIRPGEVNWMTSGSGIVHSERFHPDQPTTLEGIQLWLALPKEHEEVDASFYHCKEADLPGIEHKKVKMTLIAGESGEMKSPVPVYSSLFYFNCEALNSDDFKWQLDPAQEAAIYLLQGDFEIEGETKNAYQLIIFKPGAEIELSVSEGAKFMFFGGVTFPEKRHLWWNFVATSKAMIEDAKKRWLENDFGDVINEDEYIPLPQ